MTELTEELLAHRIQWCTELGFNIFQAEILAITEEEAVVNGHTYKSPLSISKLKDALDHGATHEQCILVFT